MEGEVKGSTFKMKGHTLPGINQRSGGNKSSTFQQGMTGMMDAAQSVQQRRNPNTPGGGGMGIGDILGFGGGGGGGGGRGGSSGIGNMPGIASGFLSKPSVAKIYAAKGKRKPNPGKY